jgi:hypothetical protein
MTGGYIEKEISWLKKIFFFFCLILLIASCSSDVTKDLGDGYFLREEGGNVKDILCEQPNSGEIPATIIDYDFDNNFIIAKQKPKLPQDPLYKKRYNYKGGGDKFYYWIINKKTHVVIGPMNELEFDKEKVKNHVPEALDDLKK